MSILEAIAGVRTPDVVGSIEQGRTDVLNRRLGAQKVAANDIEIEKAQNPKVSFKDQLAEMQAKSDILFRTTGALLSKPFEERATFAKDNLGVEGIDLSDDALKDLRSEAVYGMSAAGEFGKAEEDAARMEAMGDMEGAALARKAMASKYGKEGKIERVELHPKGNPKDSFWVRRHPNGDLERDGRILTEKELDGYTEEGVKKTATGTTGDFGLTKPVTSSTQKDVVEGRVQQETLQRLAPLYNKDFLTLQGKIKGGALWALDKIDALPAGQQKEWFAAKTKFDAGVNQAFNIYRRWVTGAAAAMAELTRLEAAYINTKDSPTEFLAKLAEIYDFSKRVDAVRMDLLKQGLQPGTDEWDAKAGTAWAEAPETDSTSPEDMAEFLEYKAVEK